MFSAKVKLKHDAFQTVNISWLLHTKAELTICEILNKYPTCSQSCLSAPLKPVMLPRVECLSKLAAFSCPYRGHHKTINTSRGSQWANTTNGLLLSDLVFRCGLVFWMENKFLKNTNPAAVPSFSSLEPVFYDLSIYLSVCLLNPYASCPTPTLHLLWWSNI